MLYNYFFRSYNLIIKVEKSDKLTTENRFKVIRQIGAN